MAADAFELGEHPVVEARIRSASATWLASGLKLTSLARVVGMMSVGAEVLCTIANRLAEEYDMGRRSHVADYRVRAATSR